jgi:RHS repeat-associated protein
MRLKGAGIPATANLLTWPGDLATVGARSTLTYDGRGFLRRATKPAFSIFDDSFETVDTSCWSQTCPDTSESNAPAGTCFTPGSATTTTATYGSEGLLYALQRQTGERHHVIHFAGRPVAQLRVPTAGAAAFTYLTADHLGTPVLAMNQAGTTLWRGGFEPFDTDWNGAAGAAGVFLRFPGQWDDSAWAGVGATGLSYNLNRWYERGTGRYERVDPIGLRGGFNLYRYGDANPLANLDPDGRRVVTPLFKPDPIDCSLRIAREAREAAIPGNDWRWAHCWASCRIARECGGASVATTFGFLKELADAARCLVDAYGRPGFGDKCASAFQPEDFVDNKRGRDCPPEKTCDDECRDLFNVQPPPPGPFFGIFIPRGAVYP